MQPTRVAGTPYQPSTTRPTLITVTFNLNVTNSNSVVEIRMDSANPPVTVIGRSALTNANAAQIQTITPISFLVPTGFWYEFVNVGSVVATIERTCEYSL